MTLPIQDLKKIQMAYRDCYDTLFFSAYKRLKRCISIKLLAIRYFERIKYCTPCKRSQAFYNFSAINMEDIDEFSEVWYDEDDVEIAEENEDD